jgi:hypothetical protein
VKGTETEAKRSQAWLSTEFQKWITLAFQTLSRPEIIRIANKNLPYVSITYGGESVSQSPLKDQEFSTFPGQNPRFEQQPEKPTRLQ